MRARPVLTLLDTNGDGTGNQNANGDYSVTPGIFFTAPPIGEDWAIVDFDVTITADDISAQGYGSSALPLVNGISIVFHLNGIDYPGGGGGIVTRNRAWISIGDDTEYVNWGLPVHEQMLRCRIGIGRYFTDPDMPKPYAGQSGILLHGHRGDYLSVVLNDDFTGILSGQYFLTRGARYYDHISRSNQGSIPPTI